ncbi:hypothetical protein GCM10009801_56220 [Streptomyces albiaxialis]|uniref:Uncharacterized protein n=1 Tax=Streptomyces albiaxialis TaxID=329523 RepID=A0ABN2WHX1_9ACTN
MRPHLVTLVEEVLAEGDEDWVMVDFLIGVAEEHVSAQGGDFKSVSLELLKTLLEEELMEIGELGETGFEAWECPVEESVERFREGSERYAWKPMGALWWLANTSKGEQWLKARHERERG